MIFDPPANETLRQKQSRFVRMVAHLIDKAHELDFELTFGDAYRDARVHGAHGFTASNAYGRPRSCHKLRLAIDLNLFIKSEFQTSTEAYGTLGTYWEALAIDACWGGRFKDGNHFSLVHNGDS